jgi:two-component sensor histidine kinase
MLQQFEPTLGYSPAVTTASTLLSPPDEAGRITVLQRYGILDTPEEPCFDRLTALAADLFEVPVSIIGFVDKDRIWFKSHLGLEITQVDRATGGDVPVLRSIERQMQAERTTVPRSFASAHAANKDGLRFCVSVPLRTADGHDLGALCVIDYAPILFDETQLRCLKACAAVVMEHLDQRLTASRLAAEAKGIAGETDHRAMNSLQLIASLLNLQSRTVGAPEAADQLRIAANRVLAVARVHQHFATDEGAGQVPALLYIHRLCSEFSSILDAEITVDGDAVNVQPTQILALGLITHELVTNARKHGARSIKVTFLAGASGAYELCVADKGEGLPEGFTLERTGGGLGLKVVTALVSQINGQLAAQPNPAGRGASFTVTFPAR